MIEHLGQQLKDWMRSDLDEIHFSLQITLDVIDLLHAMEKYFGGKMQIMQKEKALCS